MQDKSEEEEPRPQKDDQQSSTVAGLHSFQTMINELPERISKTMSKNLSVPIAFVCLLHLANEKVNSLKLHHFGANSA